MDKKYLEDLLNFKGIETNELPWPWGEGRGREWMGEDKDMREMLNIQNKKANGFDKSLGLWGRMLIDWRRIFDFITEDCWVSCKEPSYKQVSVHVCIISPSNLNEVRFGQVK